MSHKTRIAVLSFVLLVILALPITALASNTHWSANLQGVRPASGSFVLGTKIGGTGLRYQGVVRSLTGDPTAIHIHSSLDGSILVTICSGSNCPVNNSTFVGDVTAGMFAAGVDPVVFVQMLNDGQTYVNVHTAAYPAGEISGTLLPR